MTIVSLIHQIQRVSRSSLSIRPNAGTREASHSIIISRFILQMNRSFGSTPKGHPTKFSLLWEKYAAKLNSKIILLGEILTLQCNFYAAQRIQRLTQIANLYRNLYNENTLRHMVSKFAQRLQRKVTLGFLLGAVVFDWKQDKISNEEITNCIEDFDRLRLVNGITETSGNDGNRNEDFKSEKQWALHQLINSGWEPVISKPNLQVWRKSVPKSYLYEYKVFGSFTDIPARAFFSVQIDTEYRKKWDKLVIKLDVIDKDEKEGCDVIHWVMHYPYPMYSRDYVYIRKSMVDASNRVMVLVSRAIDHPACPVNKNYVRVQKYFSKMVIRPHRHFDDTGFDYVLTYFDDPEAAFPSPAYNWMASTGVPDFVQKLHYAACQLYLEKRPLQGNTQEFSPNCSFQPIYT